MIHVPILRAGREYRSLDLQRLSHVSTGETIAEVSQANGGLIARDLRDAPRNQAALQRLGTASLVELAGRAARLFMQEELPIDDGTSQSPEEFVRQQSSTTGMPEAMCRGNMEKIRFVLDEMETVLAGLTRGLDLSILDRGHGVESGRTVSYRRETDSLGAVLPSNSPGVHSLWLPSLPLRVPVVLKPGSREPWTPLRIARAFQAAGLPPEAISLYPSSHAGAAELLLRCGRSMLFGDESTLKPWRDDPRVQLHGPGWSKVLIGDDRIDSFRSDLEVIAGSVAENGGRSCINASGVWVPRRGLEVAEALAERLLSIEARPLDDPEARLAAFSEPRVARAIHDHIDRLLRIPGAEDVSTRLRGAPRLVEVGGCTFPLPTIVFCDDPSHPLASSELLFPFAAVVEVPTAEMPERLGPTLVASVLTDDDRLRERLLATVQIDRLNLGSIPTCRVSWDQPHEGNLFEHLYRRRSYQAVAGSAS